MLRLLLALGASVAGGWMIAVSEPWGAALVAFGAWLFWRYARDGGVNAAFAAFKRGDLEGVRSALRHALWPWLLARRKRAYHHWMQGVVMVAECRFAEAREHLLLAAAGDIQTENDRSLIQCLLAEVALQLEDWAVAQDHLHLARNLEHHTRIDAMIATLERRLHGLVAVAVREMAGDAEPAQAITNPET